LVKTLRGVVHGRTIELTESPGVEDGQQVEITIKLVPPPRPWGEGILRSAGIIADDPDWDRIMEEIYQARKLPRRPQMEAESRQGLESHR
jgi:hypothetical protein